MNLQLLDPFEQDYPDSIESVLSDCEAACVCFNRRGSLLATGSSKGDCTVWDFDTRGVARRLIGHTEKITSLSWSRTGRYLLSSSADATCRYWDLLDGSCTHTLTFEGQVLMSQMHPRNDSLFVAVPHHKKPIIVDISSGKPVESILPTEITRPVPVGSGKPIPENNATCASFNKRGTRLVLGSSRGHLTVIDMRLRTVQWTSKITGGSIKHIHFSRCGKHFVVNANDRAIRTYSLSEADDAEPVLENKFQDLVNRCQWNQCSFNSDGDFVIGASANKAEHNVYIWEHSSGSLVKILEGPKEGLETLDWHPVRPLIATVSGWKGTVYIWARRYQENWSAFAPDFVELEENVEYEEREDEFDIIADDEIVKSKTPLEEEDVDIDITTIDVTPADVELDDSDDEHRKSGPFFIPVRPEEDSEDNDGYDSQSGNEEDSEDISEGKKDAEGKEIILSKDEIQFPASSGETAPSSDPTSTASKASEVHMNHETTSSEQVHKKQRTQGVNSSLASD